jgi:hypothetical protein
VFQRAGVPEHSQCTSMLSEDRLRVGGVVDGRERSRDVAAWIGAHYQPDGKLSGRCYSHEAKRQQVFKDLSASLSTELEEAQQRRTAHQMRERMGAADDALRLPTLPVQTRVRSSDGGFSGACASRHGSPPSPSDGVRVLAVRAAHPLALVGDRQDAVSEGDVVGLLKPCSRASPKSSVLPQLVRKSANARRDNVGTPQRARSTSPIRTSFLPAMTPIREGACTPDSRPNSSPDTARARDQLREQGQGRRRASPSSPTRLEKREKDTLQSPRTVAKGMRAALEASLSACGEHHKHTHKHAHTHTYVSLSACGARGACAEICACVRARARGACVCKAQAKTDGRQTGGREGQKERKRGFAPSRFLDVQKASCPCE